MRTRDQRYDGMAYEFIKISITAYSLTAILGGLLVFFLIIFYPQLFLYLTTIFKKTMFYYALLFFLESAALYLYYYGWHWLQGGFRKWVHLTLGLVLNAAGTTLMFLGNTWVTFMMSPAGVDPAGVFSGNEWEAMHNFLWNPINIHRFVANIAYGGIDRRRLRGVQVSQLHPIGTAGALRLDGIQRELHRHIRAAAIAVCRLLSDRRDVRL